MTIPAPLEPWHETVPEEWIDHNGHMNVAHYMLIFDHAVDALFDYVGPGRDDRMRASGTTFAVEAHITCDRELVAGDEARCIARRLSHKRSAQLKTEKNFARHGGDGRADVLYPATGS